MTKVSVPILSYHSLDSTGSVISTRPESFAKQMEYLARQGYQSITISEWLDHLVEQRRISPKPVAITFDDGFRSVETVARPILERVGFRGTVFVTANYCGGLNNWPSQSATVPRLPLLSWNEVRALHRAGLEIGAHSLSHPPLTRISEDQLAEEIIGCKRILENEIQQPVRCFAYPYGALNERVRTQVASNYGAACGTRLGFAHALSDVFNLERIDAYYLRSDFFLARLGAPWMEPYLQVRQWLRHLRRMDRYYQWGAQRPGCS